MAEPPAPRGEGRRKGGAPPAGRVQRLAWFAALWGGSVAVVGAISFILRAWLLG